MKKTWRILLILVAVVCFGVALWYPISYRMQAESTESNLERLVALRNAGRTSGDRAEAKPEADPGAESPEAAAGDAEAVATKKETAAATDQDAQNASNEFSEESQINNSTAENADAAGLDDATGASKPDLNTTGTAQETVSGPDAIAANDAADSEPAAIGTPNPAQSAQVTPTPVPTPTPTPAPTVNRWERSGALPYSEKEKVTLDMDKILPEYREIYDLNNDFVGWITIPGMNVDYPIVQTEDSEYYLEHDFFGEKNYNGQIILDTKCDPYTPSYNLVISGHNMRSGKMFGNLVNYASKSFWEKHKIVYFDSLVEQKEYVIFAAFYSADYDVDEEGFRYNADIQYAVDAKQWLRDIHDNQIYDTEIDVKFGDEFLTLTTCNKSRRQDGRFVIVCRRIREGEEL